MIGHACKPVFERVALGCSVSAEHRVGHFKPDYLHCNKPPPAPLAPGLMALKRAMDQSPINPFSWPA